MRNCLSVDVEGFIESNLQSFAIDGRYHDRAREDEEIERNVGALLELLAERQIHGTFFFLGRIARDIPAVVRQVADAGHEIGSHSYEHLRIFGMRPDEFRARLIESKRRLEDVSGQPVVGFRAPDFSITAASLWALDILREAGFLYDSSIYPFGQHDVYGIGDASPEIYRLPNGLVEFPLSTADLWGRRLPFGGGGYFRIYPLALTRALIARVNRQGRPAMFYIHPYEAGPVIPEIQGISWQRRFRHYHNCNGSGKRMAALLRDFEFAPAVEILRERGLLEG